MSQRKQNFMLRATHQLLLKEMNEIIKKLTKEIPVELNQTYETGGGWHDNPHWDGMLQDQEKLAARLREILASLRNCTFIEELPAEYKKVVVGTEIKIKDIDTEQIEIVKIVGPLDVAYNPQCTYKQGFISYASPLGCSLIGKFINEEAILNLPHKIRRLIILEIRPFRE